MVMAAPWLRSPTASSVMLLVLLSVLPMLGCPSLGQPPATVVPVVVTAPPAEPDATTVSFDIIELGSSIPLAAYVWVDGFKDDFEVVRGGGGARFKGIGRTRDGYVVPFVAGAPIRMMVWSPQHEVNFIDTTLNPGPNAITVELRKTEIADDRVPMEVWLNVLEQMLLNLPAAEQPRTGS